jgi:Tol biopolymer transport system component
LKKFAGGVVSTGEDYGPAFTGDAKTVYFARRKQERRSASILVSQLENGKWSAPKVANFSGEFHDVEPFISPDGSKLFYTSKRPPEGTTPKKDFDLWVVEKTAAGWGVPKRLPEPVNSDGYENYPAVSSAGTLYFGSARAGGRGGVDLYRAKSVNGQYAAPENLGDLLNTSGDDADPYIAPDESYLIFSSTRPGGLGEGDLYISYNRQGVWTAPRHLGEKVNSSEWDYTPLIAPDGKSLYFSRGWGDIYQIDLKALNLDLKSR